MKKHNMKWLKEKSEDELEKLYLEYNLIISRTKGEAKARFIQAGDKKSGLAGKSLKDYDEAVRNRARILTLLNQKRYQREKL
jgi:ribosomal protein L29